VFMSMYGLIVFVFVFVCLYLAGEFLSVRISPVPANRLTAVVVVVVVVYVGQVVFIAIQGAAKSAPAQTGICEVWRRIAVIVVVVVVIA
jgi:hypothetical protein